MFQPQAQGSSGADGFMLKRHPSYAAFRTDVINRKDNNSGVITHRRCAMNDFLMFWGTYLLVLSAGLGMLVVA